MENKTKGILGAIGAVAIGAGAYFGFSGGEEPPYDGGNKTVLETNFEKLLEEYAKTGSMPDTDDANIEFESENDFNVWSWQKYLHLTQNVGTQNDYKPLFLRDMYQVGDDGLPLYYDRIKKFVDNLFMFKENTLDLDAPLTLKLFKQAGAQHYQLHSGEGDKTENLVYYSVHINKKMKTELDLYSKDSVKSDDKRLFGNGAMELKISWAKASSLNKQILDKSIIQVATILTPEGRFLRKDTMAMIGMHIAGVVNGHPEFIWSTFEHDNLTRNSSEDFPNPTILDTKSNDEFYRLHPYGVSENGNQSYKVSLIDQNQKVKNVIREKKCGNYFLNGSVWLLNDRRLTNEQFRDELLALDPKSIWSDRKLVVGSDLCANVSMETVEQGVSCFKCHTTSSRGSEFRSAVHFSHLYNNKLRIVDLIKHKIDSLIHHVPMNVKGSDIINHLPEDFYLKISNQVKKENAEYFETLK